MYNNFHPWPIFINQPLSDNKLVDIGTRVSDILLYTGSRKRLYNIIRVHATWTIGVYV